MGKGVRLQHKTNLELVCPDPKATAFQCFRYLLSTEQGEKAYWNFVKRWKVWAKEEEEKTGERVFYSRTWKTFAKYLGLNVDLQYLRKQCRLHEQHLNRKEVFRGAVEKNQSYDLSFAKLPKGDMSKYDEYYAWALNHPMLHKRRNRPAGEKLELQQTDISDCPSKMAANLLLLALDNSAKFFDKAHDIGRSVSKEEREGTGEVESFNMSMTEIDKMIKDAVGDEKEEDGSESG